MLVPTLGSLFALPLWGAQVSMSPLIATPYPVVPAQRGSSKPKGPNSFLVFAAEVYLYFQQSMVLQRKA